MKTRNRILSMLAAAGLAIGILSTTVFAAESRCDHTWKTVWDSDSNYHWYECDACKEKKDISEHDRKWKSDNDVHWRECSICGNRTSGGIHYWDGGIIFHPTSCTDGGKKIFTCKDCGRKDIEPIKAPGHRWGDTWTSDATHHWKICINANCSERSSYGQHKGGTATCTDTAVCEICGVSYYGDHAYGTLSFNEGGHWQECINCHKKGPEIPHNFSKHLKFKATCVSPEVYNMKCTDCDYQVSVPQGDVDPDNHDLAHHDAKAATCTEKGWNAYDTCTRCDYTTYAELPALNHDLVHHDAKTPTCTEIGWKAYDACTRCDYTTYVELPIDPDNHALTYVKAQAPTCTDSGWDAYDICQRCGYTTFKELPALGHWYGEWTPNGDGTQIAACKRGCGHKTKVNCAEQEYALPMGEGEEACEFTLCPVCGQVSDGTKLALVEKVTAKAVTRWLPAGEAVLRLGTLENGELVLIAGFEYAGQLTQPTGQIKFTLPAEHLKGFTLTVITPDGTETPLDYTTEKDQAAFTLDFTDTKTPTILIHLTPEA